MGAPDLPDEHNNSSLREESTNYPVFIQNNTSDESDDHNAETDEYAGYHQLGTQDIPGLSDDEINSEEDEEANNIPQIAEEPEPKVISCDAEIERLVWNAPRPVELNIELDSTKTQQILSAMSSIKLPTSAIPNWAKGIPEEKWKTDLLEKIRDKNIPKTDEK